MSREMLYIAIIAVMGTIIVALMGIVLTPDTNSVDIKVNTTKIERLEEDVKAVELTLRLLTFSSKGPEPVIWRNE